MVKMGKINSIFTGIYIVTQCKETLNDGGITMPMFWPWHIWVCLKTNYLNIWWFMVMFSIRIAVGVLFADTPISNSRMIFHRPCVGSMLCLGGIKSVDFAIILDLLFFVFLWPPGQYCTSPFKSSLSMITYPIILILLWLRKNPNKSMHPKIMG